MNDANLVQGHSQDFNRGSHNTTDGGKNGSKHTKIFFMKCKTLSDWMGSSEVVFYSLLNISQIVIINY